MSNLIVTKRIIIQCINKRFVASLLINVLLFLFCFIFVSPNYDTNDDPAMMMIASGFYTGHPSEYLVFINVYVGILLKTLYEHYSNFNWYSGFLYMVHFISSVVLFYSMLYFRSNVKTILFYLLLFMFYEFYALMNLQFTTTAFVAGQSGFFLLLTAYDSNGRPKIIVVVLSLLLLVIAGLIRWQVFLMAFMLALPIITWYFYEKKSLKIFIPLAIAVTLFVGVKMYNDHYYGKDQKWSYYFKYNKARGELHKVTTGNRLEYNGKDKYIFDKVLWSENDFNVFVSFINLGDDTYSLEKLTQIKRSINSYKMQFTFDNLKDLCTLLIKGTKYKLFILNSLILLLLSVPLMSKQSRKFIYGSGVLCCMLVVYLHFSAYVPERIFLPISFSFGTTCYFFSSKCKMPELANK